MKISRLLAVLVLEVTGFILLAVAMFGTDNLYYYRTIAYILSFALLLAFLYLGRRINKPSETAIRPFSMRTNVILVALGSFLLGATGGILVYDSYWGLNDFCLNRASALTLILCTECFSLDSLPL